MQFSEFVLDQTIEELVWCMQHNYLVYEFLWSYSATSFACWRTVAHLIVSISAQPLTASPEVLQLRTCFDTQVSTKLSLHDTSNNEEMAFHLC